jgi:hypothetical protein
LLPLSPWLKQETLLSTLLTLDTSKALTSGLLMFHVKEVQDNINIHANYQMDGNSKIIFSKFQHHAQPITTSNTFQDAELEIQYITIFLKELWLLNAPLLAMSLTKNNISMDLLHTPVD